MCFCLLQSLRGARRGRSRLTALCALAHNNEATGEAKSSSASSERLEEIPPPLAELAALLRVISLRHLRDGIVAVVSSTPAIGGAGVAPEFCLALPSPLHVQGGPRAAGGARVRRAVLAPAPASCARPGALTVVDVAVMVKLDYCDLQHVTRADLPPGLRLAILHLNGNAGLRLEQDVLANIRNTLVVLDLQATNLPFSEPLLFLKGCSQLQELRLSFNNKGTRTPRT
ncbi:uncharacterized protein LOC112572780 [Pomacea canaliculata]|uniref:uncharacterized protein LOC112572780 n=1 Tax=Pomacea canaliculata TaxID=400727 RepID=UPI000D72BBC6|nr:uncharacterized protein LOC112572780 [Pomacea canaliculata]